MRFDANLRQPLALLVAIAVVGAGACTTRPPGGARTDAERRIVPAPIEDAELIVRESSPPQHAVRVTSGLPSGCARFERIDVTRRGSLIELRVWNSVPADDDVVCTMIYGTAVNTAELGEDLESGRRYELRVNDGTRLSFVAQ